MSGLSLRISSMGLSPGPRKSADTFDSRPILLIMNGESNSGGLGQNSAASAGEVAARSSIQILSLTADPRVFADLDIGTNNLREHTGLSTYYANSHSIELGLANAIEAGRFNVEQIHLVKTGQGGSSIAQWAEGNGSGYWTEFALRIARVKTILSTSYAGYRKIIWFNLGINDIIAGTNEATWKAAVKAHLQNMRDELEDETAEILITTLGVPALTAGNDAYNDSIEAIASEMTNVKIVSTAGTTVTGNSAGDTNHWNYEDLLMIAENTVDQIVGVSGTLATPTFSPAANTFEEEQLVTILGPAGADIRYTLDGSRPTSHSTLYTAPITVSSTQTIKAIAIKKNYKNSSIASGTFTIDIPGPATVFFSWDPASFLDAAIDGSDAHYVDCTSNAGLGFSGAGARSLEIIDATRPFSVEWFIPSEAASQALVGILDDVYADNFVWNAGETFITGMYNYGGTTYIADGGYSAGNVGAQAFGAAVKYKMEKDGNDIKCYKSTNSGGSWTLLYTDTGALTGKTRLYFKVIFAEEVSTRTIAVEVTGTLIAPMDDVVASCEFDIDFTLPASNPETGTAITNYSRTPASGAAKTDYNFTTGDGSTSTTYPAITSAKAAFDGGDYLRQNPTTRTTFENTIHRTDTPQDFAFAFAIKAKASSGQQTLWSCKSGASSAGMYIGISATEFVEVSQRGDSDFGAATSDIQVVDDGTYLIVVSYDHTNAKLLSWVNGVRQPDENWSFNTCVNAATGTPKIGAVNNTAASFLASGTEVYAVSAYNEVFNNTKEALIRAQYEVRHGKDYTT